MYEFGSRIMITKDQGIFLTGCLGLLIFCGVTASLLIQSSVAATCHEKECVLLPLGLAWVPILVTWLIVRVRCPDLWSRFIRAEASLRSRFAMRPPKEWAFRLLESTFCIYLAAMLLVALLAAMACCAFALYYFPNDL
jgi:hypothetical protein